MSITVIKPPACKNCEHWDASNGFKQEGTCDLSSGSVPIDSDSKGFEADCSTGDFPYLRTGPDFYCCHFKQKGE